MSKQVSLTWEEWEEQFKPIPNSITNVGYIFETYGEEVEFVSKQDPRTIWTYLDVEMGTIITEGYHYVNRIGYYITELPYDEDTSYEVDFDPNVCDRCEEPFTQDFEHEDGLCDKCCEGCEMDEFND